MEKKFFIDGKEIAFKATGATIRLYRSKFKSDLLLDVNKLNNEYNKGDLSNASLEVFENLAYIMAKQADETLPDNPDEWLDGFNMFSIYEIFPKLIELWNESSRPIVESKKNNDRQRAE